jgi:hypothetical protein
MKDQSVTALSMLFAQRSEMNRFEAWERDNLARFSQDCYQRMKDQEKEIEALREDLRTMLDAYRRLVVEHAGKRD